MNPSDYYLSLQGSVKVRYEQKISVINNIDPYALNHGDFSKDLSFLPNVDQIDLFNYLILSHSFYSGEQMKAYKSLQAYKYYEAGFVLDVMAKQTSQNFLVVGKVRHSQKTKEKPLNVWVILLSDGAVSSAHCTCMAGLSEVCSHVAAVLFYLNARPEVSCTEQLAKWPVPAVRNVEMIRLCDMDWVKKIKPIRRQTETPIEPLQGESLNSLLRDLQEMAIQTALCRVVEPFASEFCPKVIPNLPNGLESLYSDNNINKTYKELVAQAIDIHLSERDISIIQQTTESQSKSNIWFKYRAGRITGSKFKLTCRAKLEHPPLSLIKGICYPQRFIFNSKQTSYGLHNEKNALDAYANKMCNEHKYFILKSSGFIISNHHPEVGASPDGLVNCECHGSRCVEVKCPYLLKEDMLLREFARRKHTCLEIDGDNVISLNKTHTYYYQIQLQMFVTNTFYCDFVIWSKKDLFIERVSFDGNFLSEALKKALNFHQYVIKPELLAKYFTMKCGAEVIQTWCFCGSPDDGRPMLKCDNNECEIQWFHSDCLGIIEEPNNIWFCEKCLLLDI